MTRRLRYTLVTDGTSDRALMPLLRWVLLRAGTSLALDDEWADPSRMPMGRRGLTDRIQYALELYPCDLLFVHRDAEAQDPQMRRDEVHNALTHLNAPPALCVVPVRMTEAWLLTDEAAIRRAADNPRGRTPLTLPPPRVLENLPDPKQTLSELLRVASEKQGRRLQQFRREEAARRLRVAELTEDFTPLLALPAFRRFQDETAHLLQEQDWI